MPNSTEDNLAAPPVTPPGGAPFSGLGLQAWSRDLFVSLVVSLFIILFLYQPVRVEGTSMLPRLEDQDRLVHQ